MKNVSVIIFLLNISINATAFADSVQIAAGKKIVLEGTPKDGFSCITCHLENGEGVQEYAFPQLGGMSSTYIIKQLKDYQGTTRINDVMNPIAKSLSDEDIINVAAYFASLPTISKIEKSTSATKLEEGRLIAERGLWNKGIPACFSCHGPNAVGVGENFPQLINQGKLYITQSLMAWKNGTRNNDPAMLMKTIAKKLSKKEIEAVAEYLSSISINKTTVVK